MATTTDVIAGDVRMIPLDRIRHDSNVREHDPAEVDALAGSIELLGQITPAIVRPDGEDYVLVAGHKRYAALTKLGRGEIRAEIRSEEAEQYERAAENIVRSQLDAYQEARAVEAMLAKGLSEDGAAQALGWPKGRITARMKLLHLPEQAQQMVGAGTIALSAVDQLLHIGQVSPELLEATIAYLTDGNEWAAERLAREPGWVLDAAVRHGESEVFAEHLAQIDSHRISDLRLGKKTDELFEEASQLQKQLDRYSYGLTIRFSEPEIDQARAAGVLVEFDRSAPIIVDKSLYRELTKQAIKRTVAELKAKVTARDAERKATRRSRTHEADDPVDVRREEQRQLRELAEQAHGVNVDLGLGLMNGLSTVDPADMAVARFFVFALLGSDYDESPYTNTGERVSSLAASGIRLVIDEFRTDVTRIKKDGTRGKLRIDYGDPRDPKDPIAWLWKFVDGGRSAGELYGRALVVIAAEQYASRLVVPSSQQTRPTRWSSHKDLAEKALRKLAGPHLPASLKRLERAVAAAHAERQSTGRAPRTATAAAVVEEVDIDDGPADDTASDDVAVDDENLRGSDGGAEVA